MYCKTNIYQLVNKSEFKPTFTMQGVTFTNNNDGSYTVNGTADEWVKARILDKVVVDKSHKYLFICNNDHFPKIDLFLLNSSNSDIKYDDGVGRIFTPGSTTAYYNLNIYMTQDTICNNFKVTPQIYDLTKMYGAGNEPETVEQFKSTYSNLPYEYSNNGWSKIRKVYIKRDTKNLCDFHSLFNDYTIDKRYENYGFWQVELSVKPDTYYTLSRENGTQVKRGIKSMYLGIDNESRYNHPNDTWLNHQVVPALCRQYVSIKSSTEGKLYIYFSSNVYNMYKDNQNPFGYLQLEEGQEATAYQPHGHLVMRAGKYVTETKNLFAPSTTIGNAGAEPPDSIRNFEENVWYIGLSMNNYYYKSLVYFYEIKDNYIKVLTRNPGYGLTRAFKVSPNKKYTISFKGNAVSQKVQWGFYDSTGKYLSHGSSAITTTTPENCAWLTAVFGADPIYTEQYYMDIQLEEGSTATAYQPYKHIFFN